MSSPEESNPPPAEKSAPPPPAVNISELLALAKTVLAAQQKQQAGVETSATPAPPAAIAPPAAELRAWERKKFFKLSPEQAAAAAAAKAAPFSAGDNAGYGAPAAAVLDADPLAPVGAATDVDPDEETVPAGSDISRQRRGARITPQLGRNTRPPRRPSRLPFWISGITLIAGLGLGWLIYPRLQHPLPPPAEAPADTVSGSKASALAESLALPPLAPDSLAARANAPEPATQRALALVDRGLAAEKARELEKAVRFYEQAYAEDARVPGAAYRLAELSMRRNDLSAATFWVNRSLASGENIAASFGLRGLLAARSGNLRTGIASLTAAIHADPLNARWYLFLAQMLRRGGKLQEAEQRLQQAIQRADEPQQEDYFKFLLRLTQIELGQTERLLPELRAKLSLANPPADWLLTAAAVELQRGQLEQAAVLFERAFKNQPQNYIAARLDDVYFRNFETTKELSPFYAAHLPGSTGAANPNAAARSAALISPGLTPAATLLQQPPGSQPRAPAPLFSEPQAPQPTAVFPPLPMGPAFSTKTESPPAAAGAAPGKP